MSAQEASYEPLRLDNQLCFPLYACARELVKRYKPFLDEIGLTYTQYVTMMVMWERRQLTSKEIGEKLHLDSGTLTPVLKKLEEKGLVSRCRLAQDERNLCVTLTPQGESLRDKALSVPPRIARCVRLEPKEALELYRLLHQLLDGFTRDEDASTDDGSALL